MKMIYLPIPSISKVLPASKFHDKIRLLYFTNILHGLTSETLVLGDSKDAIRKGSRGRKQAKKRDYIKLIGPK